MKQLDYLTLDVFTSERFGGNPLAVVFAADELTSEQMQAIATEFNYSETTFVLAPESSANDARVRIFTPTEEMPFAGHPNVGTAWALAQAGDDRPETLRFEEKAGLVEIHLEWDHTELRKAEVAAPVSLDTGPELALEIPAACLGCAPAKVITTTHPPIRATVGADFVYVELERGTLPGLKPSGEAFEAFAAQGVGVGIFAYERNPDGSLEARMFWPAGTVREDPATGSAAAALAGLLASSQTDHTVELLIWQGRTMGRLSRIEARAEADESGAIHARIAGSCVPIMRGTLLGDDGDERDA